MSPEQPVAPFVSPDVQLARLAAIGAGTALLEAGGELVIAGVGLLGTPGAPLGVASLIVGIVSLGVGFYVIKEAAFNYQHYMGGTP